MQDAGIQTRITIHCLPPLLIGTLCLLSYSSWEVVDIKGDEKYNTALLPTLGYRGCRVCIS